jgi:hypothetical protein
MEPERPEDRPSHTDEEPVENDNEIGYRNVDEEGDYDERAGSQGPGTGEPPADEQ